MRPILTPSRLGSMLVLLAPIFVPGTAVLAQQKTSTRIRAMIYVDPGSNLPGLDQNKNRIRGLLDWMFSQDQSSVRIDQYIGPDAPALVSPSRILADINALTDVRKDDTIFFYYAGHGATDRSQGHWLATSGGGLTRDNLRLALNAKGARTVVIFTDCCSSVANLQIPTPAAMAPLSTLPTAELNRLLRDLFLRPAGVVDITAATYDKATGVGEYAWYTTLSGGVFTAGFYQITALGGGYAALDTNKDNIVTWEELYPKLDLEMNAKYASMRRMFLTNDPQTLDKANLDLYLMLLNQPRQTPQAFSMGTTAAPPRVSPPVAPAGASPAPAPPPRAPSPVRRGAAPAPPAGSPTQPLKPPGR